MWGSDPPTFEMSLNFQSPGKNISQYLTQEVILVKRNIMLGGSQVTEVLPKCKQIMSSIQEREKKGRPVLCSRYLFQKLPHSQFVNKIWGIFFEFLDEAAKLSSNSLKAGQAWMLPKISVPSPLLFLHWSEKIRGWTSCFRTFACNHLQKSCNSKPSVSAYISK